MKLDRVSRQAHAEEFHNDGRNRDAKSHQMGLQVPRGFLSPSAAGRRCTSSCGDTSGRCSAGWRSRRRAGSRKGI